MAVHWLTALKMVPWDEVIRHAPDIMEKSKKLLGSVGTSRGPAATTMESRIAALEAQVGELKQEMVSSAELIKSLADQNAQLIQGVASMQARMRLLAGAVAVLGVALAVAFVLFAVR